jgi:hypothetical protein
MFVGEHTILCTARPAALLAADTSNLLFALAYSTLLRCFDFIGQQFSREVSVQALRTLLMRRPVGA